MPDWALDTCAHIETIGANLSGSTGTSVAASLTANTKGSWVELVSATGRASKSVKVTGNPNSAAAYLLDIGVGAAGSEQVLIADVHHSGINQVPLSAEFPVSIPAGSRVAARLACSTAFAEMTTTAYLSSSGFSGPPGLHRVVTYGAVPASSNGTVIDPGSTANTKGAWVELVLSSTAAHRALVMAVGNNNNTAAVATTWLIDIGVGGAGFEQVLIADFRVQATATETLVPGSTPVFGVTIPEGSRLAVRSQCLTNNATDRLTAVVLYGIS